LVRISERIRLMAENAPRAVAPPVSIPEAGIVTGRRQWQCSRCGSTNLGSAYMIDYSDKFRHLQLAPKALKLGRIGRMLRPFLRLVKVNAQVCRDCGAVTLEVSPDDFEEVERKYGRR
jgi:hypothetical protein